MVSHADSTFSLMAKTMMVQTKWSELFCEGAGCPAVSAVEFFPEVYFIFADGNGQPQDPYLLSPLHHCG